MEQEEPKGPVLDLDEMIAEPVEFILLGVRREMRPFDLQTFLKTTNGMVKLQQKSKDKTHDMNSLVAGYYELFSACVHPLSIEDVCKMKPQQCASLLALIMRRQYGEDLAKTYDQKKKTKISIPASSQNLNTARRSSWLKRVFFLDGHQTRS